MQETVAVTQNFVSRINLQTVLHLLRSRRSDLLSGCMLKDRGTLHDRFLSALQQQHPQACLLMLKPNLYILLHVMMLSLP